MELKFDNLSFLLVIPIQKHSKYIGSMLSFILLLPFFDERRRKLG
ncbi:MAG: hypothetical protein ABI261_02105 [Ginsengibacter sp.]